MIGRRWVWIIAAAAGVRALAFWLSGHYTLDPDTSLYAQGGLGLFPSPLGRAVGSGGVEAVAALNVAANVALVVGAARLGAARAGRPIVAALIALLAPLALWTIFAGMDTIAAALIVWALFAAERGHRKASAALGALAAGFHLAAVFVLGAVLLTRTAGRVRMVVAPLAAIALVVVLVTPYRSLLLDLDVSRFATASIATAAVFLLTFAPWAHRLAPALPAIAGGAVAAGLVASTSWETNMRYTLPAVPIAAAAASTRRASS